MSGHFLMISYMKNMGIAVTLHDMSDCGSRKVVVGDWTSDGQTWRRTQFRMADDAADTYEYPYIVGYLNESDDMPDDSCIHFYRWTTRSALAIFLGDESGNDYLLSSPLQAIQIQEWWARSQSKWYARYHAGIETAERAVPDSFKSLGELMNSIVKGMKLT